MLVQKAQAKYCLTNSTATGMKMKIALVYSHLKELGGAENVILKQTELLNKKGYETKCFFSYVDRKFQNVLPSNPHKYIESYFDFAFGNETFRILASFPFAPATTKVFRKFDILICHGYGPALWIGYTLKKLKKIKYISYIHSPPRFLYLSDYEKKLWSFDVPRQIAYALSCFLKPFLREIDFRSVVGSDFVVANSKFTANRIEKIYGVKAEVCYPPVDTEIFKPLPEKLVNEIRSSFKGPLILSGGRIAAVKRWEWLVEMLAYVKESFPRVVLAITGEVSGRNFNYVKKLIRMAKQLKVERNILFLGFKSVEVLVKLYNAADVYVYSAPKEDFGLCPVEAMACGTPVVVWNDKAGPCETVLEGETGFKAEPYDVGDLADKVLRAIASFDKAETRKNFPKYIECNFSKEKHLRKLEEIILKVAE